MTSKQIIKTALADFVIVLALYLLCFVLAFVILDAFTGPSLFH